MEGEKGRRWRAVRLRPKHAHFATTFATAMLRWRVGASDRAALEERTRERVPLDWAATQNNFSAALRALGEREGGTARLEEAAAAFDACLTVTASVWPPEWVSQVRTSQDETQAEIRRRMAK